MSAPTTQGPAITPSLAADHHPVPGAALEAPPLPEGEAELLALGNELLAEMADVMAERAANAAAERIQLEDLRARYRTVDEPLARRLAGILETLEAIHLQLPIRGGKKSRKLANGVIGTRAKPARVEVLDAAAVIAAVKENAGPDVAEQIVRTVTEEKVDHKALTAWVAMNGWARLPGTEMHEAKVNFYADPLPPAAIGGLR
jgi:phage host-nuclease inhibitor protein Gam